MQRNKDNLNKTTDYKVQQDKYKLWKLFSGKAGEKTFLVNLPEEKETGPSASANMYCTTLYKRQLPAYYQHTLLLSSQGFKCFMFLKGLFISPSGHHGVSFSWQTITHPKLSKQLKVKQVQVYLQEIVLKYQKKKKVVLYLKLSNNIHNASIQFNTWWKTGRWCSRLMVNISM